MLRLWSLLRSENGEQHLARKGEFRLAAAYSKAARVAKLQGREAPPPFISPPKHRRKRGSGVPSMRVSRGDRRRKIEFKMATETSTDGLDEASAEEVERLIAELGLVYERKVRAKEEMVELPAEPLASGMSVRFQGGGMEEMEEEADKPRKPSTLRSLSLRSHAGCVHGTGAFNEA